MTAYDGLKSKSDAFLQEVSSFLVFAESVRGNEKANSDFERVLSEKEKGLVERDKKIMAEVKRISGEREYNQNVSKQLTQRERKIEIDQKNIQEARESLKKENDLIIESRKTVIDVQQQIDNLRYLIQLKKDVEEQTKLNQSTTDKNREWQDKLQKQEVWIMSERKRLQKVAEKLKNR